MGYKTLIGKNTAIAAFTHVRIVVSRTMPVDTAANTDKVLTVISLKVSLDH